MTHVLSNSTATPNHALRRTGRRALVAIVASRGRVAKLFSLDQMDIRVGSPSDAEAVADLIACFQSELTDDPAAIRAERFLASV